MNNAKKQIKPEKPRRKAKLKIKPSKVLIYVSVFILIVVIIFIGYQAPQKSSSVVSSTGLRGTNITSVDDVIAAGIASDVAQAANLPVAPNITNLAISAQIKSSFANLISANETRPQIVVPVTANRSVTSYTVKDGENVADLAARFSISADTIKWANDLTSDWLYAGKVLKILPVNGVLYTVNAGDTLDSLAARYGVAKTRIVLYNDLEVSGLVPNTEIILPSAQLPDNEYPGYVAPVFSYYFMPGTVGNRYDWGNCTWYAYEKRAEIGRPVGSFWGNADTWALAAPGAGFAVDNKPEVGAVFVDVNSGYYGHVAVVIGVASNGDVTITEMNRIGLNIISERTITAGQAVLYQYIH